MKGEETALGEALTVNVDETTPPSGGVTVGDESDTETPIGGADTISATGELNPSIELTSTVEFADEPAITVSGEAALRQKSVEFPVPADIFVTNSSVRPRPETALRKVA